MVRFAIIPPWGSGGASDGETMGELIGFGFVLLGTYGLYRTYRGLRRGVIGYHVWSRGVGHKEEIRRDENPRAFEVHIIVPAIVNVLLLVLGLIELLLGDVFLP